jgi:hypothetical protein
MTSDQEQWMLVQRATLMPEYCNKHEHPEGWIYWVAHYDRKDISWSFLGRYCIFCGQVLP